MGEPLPGQIVDNIFVSIQQVRLANDVVVAAGDIMICEATTQYWIKAASADVLEDGWGQSRVAADNTGGVDGAVVIEAMVPPSYIYAKAGGAIHPGDYVKLDASGQKWVAAAAADLAAGTVGGRYAGKAGTSIQGDAADLDIIIIKTGVAA